MDAMKKNGLSLKEELICTHTESMETICGDVFNMLANSDKDARPTALITGNDYIAVHLIQYIKKLGLRVPDDVAVMGVDNTYLATVVTPQLTTMDFSKEEFSEKLASIMLNLLAGKVPPDEYLKVSIVVRESA